MSSRLYRRISHTIPELNDRGEYVDFHLREGGILWLYLRESAEGSDFAWYKSVATGVQHNMLKEFMRKVR